MSAMVRTNVCVNEDTHKDRAVHHSATGVVCPYCGRGIAADDEICPHCGARLTSDCTFCGTPLLPGDDECPECGMPVSGVRCPKCGTVNHRAFCRVCNAPLTRAAVRAVEKAKSDPVFVECEAMAAKAAELEEAIAAAGPAEVEELKKEQKKVVCSLNEKLKSMLPPPDSTPKEQMIFYSARKVAVTTKYVSREKVGWVCNYCGCTHDKPIECTKPELGGHWVYRESEITFTKYE